MASARIDPVLRHTVTCVHSGVVLEAGRGVLWVTDRLLSCLYTTVYSSYTHVSASSQWFMGILKGFVCSLESHLMAFWGHFVLESHSVAFWWHFVLESHSVAFGGILFLNLI